MSADRERLAEHATSAVNLDSQLLEKLDRGFEGAVRRAREAMAEAGPEADIGSCFEAGLRAVLEAAAAHPDLTRLCLVEAPGLGANALARRQGGQAPPLVAEMVVGGIYEVVQRTVRAGDISGLPELTGQLRQLWLPALRSH